MHLRNCRDASKRLSTGSLNGFVCSAYLQKFKKENDGGIEYVAEISGNRKRAH